MYKLINKTRITKKENQLLTSAAPLSPAQKRMWYLHQLNPESSAYNISTAVHFQGALDLTRLKQALFGIFNKHHILKTGFLEKDGQIKQVVYPEQILNIPQTDLSHLTKKVQKAQVKKALRENAQTIFDLTTPPLIRIHILKLADTNYIFQLTCHHIVADGWSMGIITREVMQNYSNIPLSTRGEGLGVRPKEALQYLDYVAWQKEYLTPERMKTQLAYWQKQLQGPIPFLNLPADYTRPKELQFKGARYCFKINKKQTQQIKAFCKAEHVTLFTFLLAIFNLQLFRYTQEPDICIGIPEANRSKKFAKTIGFFINTLVMRAKIKEHAIFKEFLAATKETVLNSLNHKDLPLEKIVETLKPDRSPNQNPFFQVMFAMQNMPLKEIVLQNPIPLSTCGEGLGVRPKKVQVQEGVSVRESSITAQRLDIDRGHTVCDLSLEIWPKDDALECYFEYSTELFKAATIKRFATHFETLIQSVLHNPEEKVTHLELLPNAEKHKLLYEFNDTKAVYPRDKTISQLFEEQVATLSESQIGEGCTLGKDRVAVVCGEKQLTYAELNAKANQLARVLRGKGVKPETIVGIMVERSLEMIVGIMGILKAGGAYLPLDPEYPQARISYMLQDSQTKILLTQPKFLSSLSELSFEGEVLDLHNPSLYLGDTSNLVPLAKAHNLAYVIYTSGSTGQPKGVMVEQRNLVNFIFSTYENYHHKINKNDKCLSLTNISFDVSVYEFFIPLLFGATLTLYKYNIIDIYTLTKFIIDYKITMAYIPPSLLTEVYFYLKKHKNIQLNKLLVGVEPIKTKVLNNYLKLNPEMQIINGYGPTETTICATMFQYKFSSKLNSNVSIGKPLANTQIYILDRNNEFQFLGGIGEIYIAGANVARGYLQKPKLTQEKFIDNPFIPGTKMYKTGDLAKWFPKGNILFCGRADHQVKIRGNRIECGEIEAVLNQYPGIKETIVVVKETQNLEKYLAAYYTGSTLKSELLRSYLGSKLPDYMIPAQFRFLETMPQTPNGKIDRKYLQQKSESFTANNSHIPPSTDLEKKLVQIWEEVLEVKPIGVEDDFFETGGNSLTVIDLLNVIQKKTSLKISINDFLQSLTIKKLLETKRQTYLDLDNEAKLNFPIPKLKWATKSTVPQHILLTGATGFLGIFLLKELLETTSADIYCLVRSQNKQQAYDRILTTAQKYQISLASYSTRIKAITGDLAEPGLGLAKPVYTKLAKKIDSIYHNGALVNFVYPYQKLKDANVNGTKEVLKFATTKTTKPIHYVSTISVFDALHYQDKKILENHILKEAKKLYGGYAQSKWVAEQLMLSAKKQGMPICIYRPGRIGGDSKTGVSHTNDFWSKFVKGIVQLQKAPDLDIEVEMSSVDSVSKSMVYISTQPQAWRKKAFHLTNPVTITLKYLLTWMHDFGYQITVMPYQDWVKELGHTLENNQANELKSLWPLFSDIVDQGLTIPEIYSQRKILFDTKNTQSFLRKSQIMYHPLNEQLLETYFNYFIKIGFLPKPISQANK
jgi:amino acid adenylation domain-containing protein/thioester reductase-like protein